ncbi:hypothetical protein NLG97_g6071 [Lecanicillium saksenae]|uniref:Uncharacterized protein n=1 Tax=Lecanicillium saksenae TaxID=468837 RepID=A0ACC1QR84_9HYPO|nr:hypothetical protein NLG97_g6071 [Lecanicillium saksenae]
MKVWYQLKLDKFQAPHAAFTEDQWIEYAAKVCDTFENNLCGSFHTYLQNHPGAVDGTDLSWWVVDVYMMTAKTDDYYHSNDNSVTHSRVFNSKSP